jgi:hypothetical protein
MRYCPPLETGIVVLTLGRCDASDIVFIDTIFLAARGAEIVPDAVARSPSGPLAWRSSVIGQDERCQSESPACRGG